MPIDFQFGIQWQYGEKKGSFAFLHSPFKANLRDWSGAFALIAEDVLQPHVQRLFETEGAAEGVTWKELAPSTVKKRGSEHPILQVSGRLKRSFTKSAEDHHEEITSLKLVWGSDVPYAMFHELGTGGRFTLRAAGARRTVARTRADRERLERSQSQPGGLVPRPMLVYSRQLANDIRSRMIIYMEMMARRTGYGIFGREVETPLEARRIGDIALGIR